MAKIPVTGVPYERPYFGRPRSGQWDFPSDEEDEKSNENEDNNDIFFIKKVTKYFETSYYKFKNRPEKVLTLTPSYR